MTIRSFDPETDHWFGQKAERLTVTIYVDFTCLHCKEAFGSHTELHDEIAKRGTLVIRHFPNTEPQESADRAARAAIAAANQGQFWPMCTALFETNNYSLPVVLEIAKSLELDLVRFSADLESVETALRLERDLLDVQSQGLQFTPALFVNGRLYDGPWDLTAILETVRRPATAAITGAFRDFFGWAAAGGLVLIVATLIALLIANLGGYDAYHEFFLREFALSFGEGRFALSLEAWINDGLMAVFFLLVGIEIKREILEGELSDMTSAALPLVAALGGMLVPAALYSVVAWQTEVANGWGVPMATDIAFTIGLLAMLGARTPAALKVFVSALAVADDLGAILVIAVFYGHGFHLDAFVGALVVLAIMIALNLAKVYSRAPYLLLGIVLWVLVHESGLHATLAGVLTAAVIPSRPKGNPTSIAAQASALLQSQANQGPIKANILGQIEAAIDRLREPGYHIERNLQGLTNFLILPLFAFANTGIVMGGGSFDLSKPEILGVIVGLCIGKPLGIMLFCWAAISLGVARLPTGVNFTQILGAGCLAGVGFTMSIFIATAAFTGPQLASIKLAILAASALSAILGVLILSLTAGRKEHVGADDRGMINAE